MRKTYLIWGIAILICVGFRIHGRCAIECRKAYTVGYYAGFASKICNLGFDYNPDGEEDKFDYVGVGNENSNIYPYYPNMTDDLNRRRGKRFWWAKRK